MPTDTPVEAPKLPPEPASPEPVIPELVLVYEAQPWRVTQAWGVPYNLFGIKRHHGIDIAHGWNGRLRAPFDFHVYRTLWQPNGGGRVLTIVSTHEYRAPDGKPAHVMIDYMHLMAYRKTEGSGKKGELIATAGNTGYTTGPHTHIKDRWVREVEGDWVDVERNDAANSFDPVPYYDGTFAVDYA